MKKTSFEVLQDFLITASDDHRIHPAHISLYVTLVYCWSERGQINPIDMSRDELMKRSKIVGRGTYQKCLRDLQEAGYIIYKPTFNRFENAKIEIVTQ